MPESEKNTDTDKLHHMLREKSKSIRLFCTQPNLWYLDTVLATQILIFLGDYSCFPVCSVPARSPCVHTGFLRVPWFPSICRSHHAKWCKLVREHVCYELLFHPGCMHTPGSEFLRQVASPLEYIGNWTTTNKYIFPFLISITCYFF